MSKKIAIERVELKIGEKVIALTLDEASELRDILAKAFPSNQPSPVPIIINRQREYWPYPYPVWHETPKYEVTTERPAIYETKIWCGNTSNGTLELSAQ